jgi:hypothetical protein
MAMTCTGRRSLTFVAVCLASLWSDQTARAGLLQVGGTFTVQGTNFTTNYSQTATVGVPTLVSNNQVLLTETINPTAGGGEWDDFSFTTVNGGPLAGNINAFWRLQFFGIPTTQSAIWDNAYIYWTVNGQAVDPIHPFAGGSFGIVNPNPIDPSLGPVFGAGSPVLIEGPTTSFDATPFAFLSPYSFVSAGGVDPSTANGLHIGFHFDSAVTPAPEPSSIVLLSTAGFGLLGLARRQRAGAGA